MFPDVAGVGTIGLTARNAPGLPENRTALCPRRRETNVRSPIRARRSYCGQAPNPRSRPSSPLRHELTERHSSTRQTPERPAQPAAYVKAARFDWLTPVYDLLVVTLARERRWKPRLLAQIGLKPGMRVLDLGCGTGTLAIAVAQAEPAAAVVGLDGDPKILARARRKAAAANADVGFVEGMAQAPPFPPGSFDAIVSSLLFHHLRPADKDLALRRARALLRPGGRIHIADWGRPHDPLMRLLSLSVRVLDGSATTRDSLAGALPSLLARAGFSDVAEKGAWRTPVGTLRLLSATTPPDDVAGSGS